MSFLKSWTAFFTLLAAIVYSTPSSAQDTYLGEKIFKKCKACHAVGAGAKNKVGPHLNALAGRKAGSLEGYKYSKAMAGAGEEGLVWTKETLGKFLAKPKAFMKKTKMAFPGLEKEEDRANVIAYLLTLAPPKEDATKSAAKPKTVLPPPDFSDAYMSDLTHVALGKELWFGQCTHCHGFKAYPGKAPKLKPGKYTAEFVYKRVTKGFKKMPGWEEVFSQAERMAIVAYVKSKSFSP